MPSGPHQSGPSTSLTIAPSVLRWPSACLTSDTKAASSRQASSPEASRVTPKRWLTLRCASWTCWKPSLRSWRCAQCSSSDKPSPARTQNTRQRQRAQNQTTTPQSHQPGTKKGTTPGQHPFLVPDRHVGLDPLELHRDFPEGSLRAVAYRDHVDGLSLVVGHPLWSERRRSHAYRHRSRWPTRALDAGLVCDLDSLKTVLPDRRACRRICNRNSEPDTAAADEDRPALP